MVLCKLQCRASQLPYSGGNVTSVLTSCTPKSTENAIFGGAQTAWTVNTLPLSAPDLRLRAMWQMRGRCKHGRCESTSGERILHLMTSAAKRDQMCRCGNIRVWPVCLLLSFPTPHSACHPFLFLLTRARCLDNGVAATLTPFRQGLLLRPVRALRAGRHLWPVN